MANRIRLPQSNALVVLLFLQLLSLLVANCCCAGETHKNSSWLVGRWKCEVEYGAWTIERKADGTFEKRGRLVETIGKPPVEFSVSGRWRVSGDKYIERWDDVSPASWKELKGAERRATILLLERNTFRRLQQDSPVFIETRIE
jgi:hypothetical protein